MQNVSRALIYRGVISKVAKRLLISPSFVSRVARGMSTSARVQSALKKEIENVERVLREEVA